MNLSLVECIKKYYCVDRSSFGSNMYYVKPAGENIRDLTGQFIPYDRTYNEGKCVFLDDNNLCEIYLVRPHTARIMECWTPNPLEYDHMKGWRESNVLTEIYTDWEDVDE